MIMPQRQAIRDLFGVAAKVLSDTLTNRLQRLEAIALSRRMESRVEPKN